MSEWSQGLTLAQNVDWGFLFSTTFPTSGVITQPHYIYMSFQGIMSSKESNNNPGLCPIEGQKFYVGGVSGIFAHFPGLVKIGRLAWRMCVFLRVCRAEMAERLSAQKIFEQQL